jgi:hypothetical protein
MSILWAELVKRVLQMVVGTHVFLRHATQRLAELGTIGVPSYFAKFSNLR